MSTETKAVHTPGPWTTSQQRGLRMFIVGNDQAIAEVLLEEKFNEELFANANLIAAAPDMLEALKAMHAKYAENCDCGTCVDCKSAAAIRKAEGQL